MCRTADFRDVHGSATSTAVCALLLNYPHGMMTYLDTRGTASQRGIFAVQQLHVPLMILMACVVPVDVQWHVGKGKQL